MDKTVMDCMGYYKLCIQKLFKIGQNDLTPLENSVYMNMASKREKTVK
jgi:hypothetical protein